MDEQNIVEFEFEKNTWTLFDEGDRIRLVRKGASSGSMKLVK